MTVHLITFSDSSMSRSAQLCAESSKHHGVDTHARFTPGNVGSWPEVKSHPKIFRQPEDPRRAWSWWAFKPLIIAKELSWLPDGSILIYSDAGIEFLNNVNYIIDRMDQPLFLFGNMWEHAYWCKADIINTVWPGSTWDDYGKQCQASVIFIRVCDYSRAFIREWLHWCLFEGGRLIDDSPSRTTNHEQFAENRWDQAILTTIARREGVALHDWPASYSDGAATYPRGYLNADHEKFEENRHDQAILTTMARREGLNLHWWPAMYNDGGFTYEKGHYKDDYPTLFHHHRKRNHEWSNVA